jgi:activator of HSP90 ATPase
VPEPAILQSVKFNCPPSTLFAMYMDSAKHSASTGQRAKISRRAGGSFTAFNGAIRGTNLLVIANRMVVQAWRSSHWKRSDPDSILIFQFSKAAGGSQVDLVHVNVPDHEHKGVTEGWKKYYWKPWKAYLSAQKRKA